MTAQTIYERALDLCGLRTAAGQIPSSCDDLTQRAPSLITLACARYVYLDKRLRSQAAIAYPIITSLAQTVDMDDAILIRIVPYTLAATLINDEDAALSDLMRGIADAEEHEIRVCTGKLKGIKEVY